MSDTRAALRMPRKVERLYWWDAQQIPPDNSRTVLVLFRDARPFGAPKWATGYWDAPTHLWRDDDGRAFPIGVVVTHWTEPNGPRA